MRFTVKTLAILAEKYGTINDALAIFSTMAGGQMGVKELIGLTDLVSAALSHGDETLTAEFIADTMDVDEIMKITPQIIEAFLKAMGVKNDTQKKTAGKLKPMTGRGNTSTQSAGAH